MKQTQRTARLHAAAQTLNIWFCDMLLWLADFFGDSRFGAALRAQVREDLTHARRKLREIIVLLALAQLAKPFAIKRPHHPFRNPRGFARSPQRGAEMRHMTRMIPFRGKNLREHFAHLRAVVDRIDAHVLSVAKRIDTPSPQRQPRAVRPPAITHERVAPVAPTLAGPVLETGPPC